MEDSSWGPIEVHIPALMNGAFTAAALLISFGGIIGRVSPIQLIVLSLVHILFYFYISIYEFLTAYAFTLQIEVVVYTFNKRMILEKTVGLADGKSSRFH